MASSIGPAEILAVRGLSAGYGGRAVISGIDLSLERGDILGLLGANGSGKSTLLRAITGQIRPLGGSVTVDGADLAGAPERAKSGFGLAMDPSDLPAALSGRQYLQLVASIRGCGEDDWPGVNVVDRLGKEVVGARLEAAHPVLRLIERRYHDHRDVQGGRIGLDPAADLDAIHPRHHHVEQHDVRFDALDAFERVQSVHRGRHLEIFGHELRLEQANIGQNVVDNQHFGSHALPFRKPSMVSRKLTTEIGLEI